MSSADSVKVAVRVRPFKDYEIEGKSKCIVQMNGPQTILVDPASGKENKFTFDYSYWSFNSADANFADNRTLWNDMGESMLANCWQGYNTSMFAYGQTGSGKSYSMIGYPGKDEGLVTMASKRIFQKIEESKSQNTVPIEYGVEASMLEIYNEEIKDLFNPKNNPTGGLKIRENPQTGVYVENLSKHVAQGEDQILKLLKQGEDARTTGATAMNKTSSRAHTVFILYVKQTVQHPETKQKVQKVSSINLVDLAGSERMARTGATGARAQEGININLSLTSLGNVIKALADKCTGKNATAFIPYRDSKLTHLLKESLGGNSRTIMIAAISPADVNYDESLSTLRYADRAKQIVNKAIVNEDPSAKIISQLRAEVERLKNQLAGKGMVPVGETEASAGVPGGIAQAEYEKLKEQLDASQKLITEMQMTTEEKIRRTEEMAKDREDFFKEMNVEIDFDKTKLHISNLNEDQLLSGKLNYYVQDTTTVGSSEGNTIRIQGAGILETHATISGGFITPAANAKVFLNGVEIKDKSKVKNGDRIVFGSRLIYQYNNPSEGPIANCDWNVAWEEYSKNMIDEKTNQLVQEHKKRELEMQETINSVKGEIEKQRQAQKDLIQQEIENAKKKEDLLRAEYTTKEKLLQAELLQHQNDEQRRRQIEQMLESEKKKNEEQVLVYQRELETSKMSISSSYQKQIMDLESKLMAEINVGKKHKEDLERENQALQQKIMEKEAEYQKKINEEKDFLQKKEQLLVDEKMQREIEIQKLISENQHNGALVSKYEEELKKEKERIDGIIKAQNEMFAQSEEKIRVQINSEVTVLKEKLEKSKQAEEDARKYKEQLSKVEEEMTRKNKEHEETVQREKEKFLMREKELVGSFQAKERELLAKIESGASEEEVNELRNQLISAKQENQKQMEKEREEYERKLGENRLKMTAVRAIFKTQIQKSNTVASSASTKAEEKITLLQQKYLEEKMAQQEEIERQKLEVERQQQEMARAMAQKQSELLLNAEKDTKAMLEQMRLIELEREEKERDFQRKELEMSMKLFDMENRLQQEMAEKSQIIIEKAVKTTVIASTASSDSVSQLVPWIQEASIMVAELKKNVAIDLKLVGSNIEVEVTDLETGHSETWTRDMFETRLNQLRSFHLAIMNGNYVDNSADPFLTLKTVEANIEAAVDPSVLKERITNLEQVNQQLTNEKTNLIVDLNIALAENESLRSRVKKTGKANVGSKYYRKLKKNIKKLEQDISAISSKQKAREILSEFDDLVGESDDSGSSSDSDSDNDFDAMMRKARSLTKTAVKEVSNAVNDVPPPKSGKKSKGEKNQSQICNIQ